MASEDLRWSQWTFCLSGLSLATLTSDSASSLACITFRHLLTTSSLSDQSAAFHLLGFLILIYASPDSSCFGSFLLFFVLFSHEDGYVNLLKGQI